MESNYQTTNQNIFSIAINLSDKEKYKEIKSTDSYIDCNYLVIDHLKKQFFFTKKSTENHIQQLLKLID